jgi:hypothetical protein
VDRRRGREPSGRLVRERGPVDPAPALAEVGAVALVRHARAAPVRLDDVGNRAADAHRERCERRDVRRVAGVGQRLGMAVREPEAPLACRRGCVLHLEQAGDRLLLEPLACVALVDARTLREPGRGHLVAGQRAS